MSVKREKSDRTWTRRIFSMLLVFSVLTFSGFFPVFAGTEGGPGMVTEDSEPTGRGEVSVHLKLDGQNYPGVEVTLRQEKEIMYTLLPGPGEDEYSAGETVEDGIYNIVVDGKDSARTISVEEHAGSAKVTMYSVTFLQTKDGEEVERKNVFLGDTVAPPDLDGQKFLGWMTEEDTEYDFTEEVDGKLKLYGKWESLENSIECGLEHVELEGAEEVVFGEAFEGTLVPEEGYELPEKIEVFAGDEEITDFTYDPETGDLSIPEGKITGDLSIRGDTVEGEIFAVTSTIQNVVLIGSTANCLQGYSGELHANTGYALPSKLNATMGGEEFTGFSYNPGNGKITVPANVITGDLVFSGVSGAAMTAGSYRVIGTIGHGKTEYSKTKTTKMLEVQIVPDSGYEYPKHIIVVSGGMWFDDYSYDPDTGKIQISSAKVSTVVISAVCPEGDEYVKEVHEFGFTDF